MRTISLPNELHEAIKNELMKGKSVGFVPTMGALHQGHLRLVETSNQENDLTVVSIFVNPLQFNNSTDLAKYPRVLEEDLVLLEQSNVDYVFTPLEKVFYAVKPEVSIDFGAMSRSMEGKFRKGHFEGVGLVVSKLLHIVGPTRAYFGKKDLQQFLLIKKMCADLSFPVEIIGVDTVREQSGLAMSSRNRQLSPQGLQVASHLNQGLEAFRKGIAANHPLPTILQEVENYYKKVDGLEMEYTEVVNAENLQSITSYEKLNELAVCVAGYVEGVRLIDNLYLRLK